MFSSFMQYNIQKTNNTKTKFAENCIKISDVFKNQVEHGHISCSKSNKYLSLLEFSKILIKVSEYDLNRKLKYNVTSNQKGKLNIIIWKAISNKDKILSFEKRIFKTIIEQELNGKKYQNEFIIVDYIINRSVAPKKVLLRLAQNEFEKLTMDEIEYNSVFESRLLGIDEAIEELKKELKK